MVNLKIKICGHELLEAPIDQSHLFSGIKPEKIYATYVQTLILARNTYDIIRIYTTILANLYSSARLYNDTVKMENYMKKIVLFLTTVALVATISGCSHCKYKKQNKAEAKAAIAKVQNNSSMTKAEKSAAIKSIKAQMVNADKACVTYESTLPPQP